MSAQNGMIRTIRKAALSLLVATAFSSAAIAAPAKDANAPRFDAGVISGLGARNIGSAAMSGRIAAVAAVPAKDGKTLLMVGAASGGVWKSTDSGTTFKSVFDKQTVQSIGSIAIDPSNHDTIWVGTGESWTRNSVSIGDGIYKSTDGGDTWTNMGLKDSERIAKILVDPRDGNTVYACAPGKLWSDSADRGLYKTTDGGKSWTLVLKGKNLSTGCSSISLDPKDSNTIFAALWDFRRKGWTFRSGGESAAMPSDSGLFRSADGGRSWTEVTDSANKGFPKKPFGRIAVAVAPSASNIVYAFVESTDSALFRSDDGGKTWDKRDKSQLMVWRPFYFANLIVDPKNPDRLFKPDLNLIQSLDGGKSFANVGGGTHGDHHDVWIDPTDTQHVISGDDGGLWQSYDGGNKWWKQNNLPVSQFYHVSIDQSDPFHVYGGLQDNSSWVGDSAVSGRHQQFALGEHVRRRRFLDVRGPGRSELHLRRIPGRQHRAREPHDARAALDPARGELQRKAALELEHADRAVAEREGHDLHRLAVPVPLARSRPELGPHLAGSLDQRSAEAEAGRVGRRHGRQLGRRDAHDDLLDQRIAEGGRPDLGRHRRWQRAADARRRQELEQRRPQRQGRARAFVGVVGAGRQFRRRHRVRRRSIATRSATWRRTSTRRRDYGKTWNALVSPKDAKGVRGYVHVIKQDPVKPEILYAGTEFGLWISIDGGKRWAEFKGGDFPAVAVRDMAFQNRDASLALATHGRGIWIIDDLTPLRALDEKTLDSEAAFLATRPIQQRINAFGGWAEGDASFTGPNPPNGAEITYYQKGRHLFGKLKIDILDDKGALIDTIPASVRRGINRVTWSMRVKPPRVPPAAQIAFNSTQGPRVPPGTYTVRMTKDKEVYETKIDVGLDRRVTFSAADRRAQYDAAMNVLTLFGEMSALVDQINAVRAQADATGAKLPANDPMRKQLADLSAKADEMRKKIVATKEGGAITGEERLREHTDTLYGAIMSYDGKPSDYQIARIDALNRELGDVKQQFAKLREGDLAKTNASLRAKNQPEIAVPDVSPNAAGGTGGKPDHDADEPHPPWERD